MGKIWGDYCFIGLLNKRKCFENFQFFTTKFWVFEGRRICSCFQCICSCVFIDAHWKAVGWCGFPGALACLREWVSTERMGKHWFGANPVCSATFGNVLVYVHDCTHLHPSVQSCICLIHRKTGRDSWRTHHCVVVSKFSPWCKTSAG